MNQSFLDSHPEYIDSIPAPCTGTAEERLARAKEAEKALFKAESEYILRRRATCQQDPVPSSDSVLPGDLIGLALSGGGIRSATFSLGIMQSCARHGILSRVDYLSTVSGGGYIGSAVTWFTRQAVEDSRVDPANHTEPPFDCTAESFPFGSDDPRPGKHRKDNTAQLHRLSFLRNKGYYLTPGAGISAVSLLGAVLRGTLLNLLVWVPIFVFLFTFCFFAGQKISKLTAYEPTLFLPAMFSQITPALQCDTPDKGSAHEEKVCADLAMRSTGPESVGTMYKTLSAIHILRSYAENPGRFLLFEIALAVSALTVAFLFLFLVGYSLSTHFSRGGGPDERTKWYQRRRSITVKASKVIVLALAAFTLGTLPVLAALLHNWFLITGPSAVLTGMAIAMKDFLQPKAGTASSQGNMLAVIGALLFLFGLTIICFYLSLWIYGSSESWPWFIAVLLVSCVSCFAVNLNYISIHRFYRDRLMEAFLPDLNVGISEETGMAKGADTAYLDLFARQENPREPYHIVNTNVVLVNSQTPTYKNRRGDNFILSPLYCGCNATGWNRTDKFMDGRMTLPTAVAISGAAANPNTGVGGAGVTRNLIVSLAMSLLNLRLGYWATRPRRVIPGEMPGTPNHFIPGTYSFGNASGLPRMGFNEHRKFMQLSDGGHFENMALYELIRRRVKIAIVCDGGADSEFSFSDMQTTVRRVEEDFGAEIEILDSASPDRLVPVVTTRNGDNHAEVDNPVRYPKDVGFSPQGHMYAKISYVDGSSGLLIYLKTALVKEVSFRVKGYAALNPDFPDESTGDQFFDNVQFNAYRELGYTIAELMLESDVPPELVTDLGPGAKMVDLLREDSGFSFDQR